MTSDPSSIAGRRARSRRALRCCSATPAHAQDPEAPKGAPKHWLAERGVDQLPLAALRGGAAVQADRPVARRGVPLGARRASTMAQLARKQRLGAARPGRGAGGAATRARERREAARARRPRRAHADPGPPRPAHPLPRAAPDRRARSSATEIFGTRDREEFLKLRRAELSPLQICELNGTLARGGAARRVRRAARRGGARRPRRLAAGRAGRGDAGPPAAPGAALARAEPLQRAVGRRQQAGSAGGRRRPSTRASPPTAAPSSGTPTAPTSRRPSARRDPRPRRRARRSGGSRSPRRAGRRPRRPRSAYNSVVSADGTAVAFETAESTYPLAKRVGQMTVLRARPRHRARSTRVSHAFRRRARRRARPSTRRSRPTADRRLRGDRRRPQRRAVAQRPVGRGSQGQARAARHRRVARRRLPAARSPATGSRSSTPRPKPDNNGLTHVYSTALEDRQDDARLARRRAPARAAATRTSPSVSRDGRSVAFTSRARNLGGDGHAGRLRARSARGDDAAGHRRDQGRRRIAVAVRRRPLRRVRRARRAAERQAREPALPRLAARPGRRAERAGEPGGRRARRAGRRLATEPAISADGQRVAFASTAGNLGEGKPDGIAGVFVRDLARGTTTLLSTHAERPGTGPDVVRIAAPAGTGVAVLAGLLVFWRRRSARALRDASAPQSVEPANRSLGVSDRGASSLARGNIPRAHQHGPRSLVRRPADSAGRSDACRPA